MRFRDHVPSLPALMNTSVVGLISVGAVTAKPAAGNRPLIDTKMPHLASVLCSELKSALGDRGVLLVAQQCATIDEPANHVTPGQRVIDINGWPELRLLPSRYEAFCW